MNRARTLSVSGCRRLGHSKLGASRLLRGCVLGGAAFVWASSLAPRASAHIDLLEPVPRAQGDFRYDDDPNSNLKEGPCGQVENGRTDRVTALRGGQQLTVRFTEWISHRSYYRVALDTDGDDDFPLRGAPSVLSAEGDHPEELFPVDGVRILAFEHNDQSGGEYAIVVTVPNLSCDRCTLQLVQYMYGSQRPYYFQCADITIEADPALPLSPDPDSLPAWDLEAARNSRRDPDAGLILPPWPRSSPPEEDAGTSQGVVADAGAAAPEPRGRDTGCSMAERVPAGGAGSLLALAFAAIAMRRRKVPWNSFLYAARRH